MQIRNIREDEKELSIALSEFAFQYKLTPERREQVLAEMKPERVWAYFDNENLVSKMTILPFEAWLHGVKFKMGGIAGVATWPEYRRKGLVSGLLKHGLKSMREQGQTISILHPFSFPFYRKFGWETLTDFRKYELETNQLPVYPPYAGTICRERNAAKLQEVYEPFAARYSGMLVRDEVWWQKLLRDKNDNVAIYENADGAVRGYLMYSVKDHAMAVEELVALDEESRRALWRFIADHDSMMKKITVTAPMDDALPFLLADPRIKQETIPYCMARIVDVLPLLERFPWAPIRPGDEPESRIRLRVRDEHAPWNNGVYALARQGETVTVGIVESDAAGAAGGDALDCDIATLSAMLFGYQRPTFMYRIGRLQGDASQADLLDKWIPSTDTFFMDFF